MANEFYALMGRMRYITRWGLMRNSFSENIQEHSHQVAVLAHALALIRREILGMEGPDPDKCTVAALGADRCVYVGDSDVDILTAKRAGVPCLSVTWGFREEPELREAGAEYFCHDPAQLPQCIENILQR